VLTVDFQVENWVYYWTVVTLVGLQAESLEVATMVGFRIGRWV
jgi:hypothetical protein